MLNSFNCLSSSRAGTDTIPTANWKKDIKAKAVLFRVQHWLNFICHIIGFHCKEAISELEKNVGQQKLSLFAPFSLSKTADVAN